MAYNKGRANPDALPHHAQPDEAAAAMPGEKKPAGVDDRRRHDANYQNYNQNQHQPQRPNGGYGRNDPHYNPQGNGRQNSYGSHPGQPYRTPPSNSHEFSGSRPGWDNYGQSPPPPHNPHGRPPPGHRPGPPPASRPPPTPAPPRDGNDREALWKLFGAVDKDRSGQLDEKELRAALVNGDWTPFDPHTVRMMIRMFDVDRSGSVDFEEFCGLWGFLAAWRDLFDRFDRDRSGNISLPELERALEAFGYVLSKQFVSVLFKTYDKRGEGAMSFDLFIQACISLKRMTDVFKKYDKDRIGYITISFEEFLTEILAQAV